ncbi:MAG: hypothetical protein JW900_15655 [Anaerolineae bacterium]|nr:hypothetical protein [Anaerolineae bacterium]
MAYTCPKCTTGSLQPMEWKLRVMLALFSAAALIIPGLALTMIGFGIPFLVAAPLVAFLFLILPWKRCDRCGHITARASGK